VSVCPITDFSTQCIFNVDNLPVALQLVHNVRHKYPNATFKFSRYSMGGALALLVALHFQAPAFTFAANGTVDIIACYHLHPDAPKTVKLMLMMLFPKWIAKYAL
jgi:putative lipase involved disintegration of autophagic bodies